jgi:hypothetical protein
MIAPLDDFRENLRPNVGERDDLILVIDPEVLQHGPDRDGHLHDIEVHSKDLGLRGL